MCCIFLHIVNRLLILDYRYWDFVSLGLSQQIMSRLAKLTIHECFLQIFNIVMFTAQFVLVYFKYQKLHWVHCA